MSFINQPLLRYSIVLGFISLGGCADNPLVKTPVGWYHGFEGGIVAQPRLPVPGNDKSYPYVGLTPTQAPPLPSPALRNQITESLSKDIALSDWQNTVSPIEIPKIPAPPQQNAANVDQENQSKANSGQPAKAEPKSQQTQENSATFDAVGQDPTPPAAPPTSNPQSAQNQKPAEKPSESKPEKKTEEKKKPIPPPAPVPVVMPELRAKIDNQAVVIPAIPVSPPAPSKFPGFNIPSDANLPAPFKPTNLPLERAKGDLITFPIDSDTPNPKQEGLINSIAWNRHGRTIYVHGYGDAASISPESQSKALSLALLRAKTVAKLFIAHNVPESSIVIHAHAIGHGVRIRMDE